MPLCDVCLNVDFGAILWPDVKHNRESIGGWPRNHELFFYTAEDARAIYEANVLVPHHKTFENLKANARHCELCLLIETCVLETLEKIKYSNQEMRFRYIPESDYEFWLLSRHEANGFQIIGSHKDLKDEYRIMGGAGICVRDDSPLASVVEGRTVSSTPKSLAVVNRIRVWMQDCEETHNHVQYRNKEGPTRVLNIEDNGQKVHLYEKKLADGEYTALSYCWGDGARLTLNQQSSIQLRNGIQTTDLPKTFQDAVWLTHQLGIQYLWIDSLCIFQDDPNDWARESARMATVYGNSTITIAASCATSSSAGFLGERAERNYVAAPFRHGHLSGELLIFPLHVRLASDVSRYARLEDEPLTTRGWVLQERYLSPRTVHFGSSQVCFECKDAFITEDSCSASPSRGNWQYRLPIKSTWDREWSQVVVLYSQRELSVKTDKLPAIAGIAEIFSRISNDTATPSNNRYLAGLWQDNIIPSLCWTLDIRKQYRPRCSEYRAPTWSWASLDTPTYFVSVEEPLAIFQDSHMDLESPENPFGKVTGGWIMLRARKYPLCLGETVLLSEGGTRFSLSTISCDDQEDRHNLLAAANTACAGHGETPVMVIPLASMSEFQVHLIILKAVDHKLPSFGGIQGFQRLGIATLDLSRPEDRHNLDSLRLPSCTEGASNAGDGLEDVLLL